MHMWSHAQLEQKILVGIYFQSLSTKRMFLMESILIFLKARLDLRKSWDWHEISRDIHWCTCFGSSVHMGWNILWKRTLPKSQMTAKQLLICPLNHCNVKTHCSSGQKQYCEMLEWNAVFFQNLRKGLQKGWINFSLLNAHVMGV